MTVFGFQSFNSWRLEKVICFKDHILSYKYFKKCQLHFTEIVSYFILSLQCDIFKLSSYYS